MIRQRAQGLLAFLIIVMLLPAGMLPPALRPQVAQAATSVLSQRGTWFSAESETTRSIAWGDADNDGDLDLVVGNNYGPNRLYLNANGTLSSTAAWASPNAIGTTSLAWGDVDRDGDLDLVIGNYAEQNQIYRNCTIRQTNDGCTSADTLLSAGAAWFSVERDTTTSVAWGDVDADGDLDLAVGNSPVMLTGEQQGGQNRIYYNNGTGADGKPNLTLAWSSAETESTSSIALGDVDGDGDLDLAVGNAPLYNSGTNEYKGGNNQIYRNDGVDLLNQPIMTLAWESANQPENTTSVAWGDVNGDGKLDLAVGNSPTYNYTSGLYEGGQEQIYRNDTAYVNGPAPIELTLVWSSAEKFATDAVAWGDADADGDLDLAVGGVSVSDPSTLTQIGGGYIIYKNTDGALSTTISWASSDEIRTYALAWGDLNGDGQLDLAVGTYAGQLRVYTNVQSSLSLSWSSPASDSNPFLYGRDVRNSVAWGDLNSDGTIDLITGNDGGGLRLYANTGAGLAPTGISPISDTDQTRGLAWGDVDGDGDLDLAVAMMQNPAKLFLTTDGALSDTAAWSSTEEFSGSNVAWGDVDGDGDLDLAVGHNMYTNTHGTLSGSGTGYHDQSVVWGDVDGDGDLDLIASSSLYPTKPRLYTNTNGVLRITWEPQESGDVRSMALGDMDGDSDLDLAVGSYNQPLRIYTNSKGAFSSQATWSSSENSNAMSLAWGDVDGDGDLDLAVGNDAQPNRIYMNSQGTLSSAVWFTPEQHATTGVAWGDIDADGDLDLAVGNKGEPHLVYTNLRNRISPQTAPIIALSQPQASPPLQLAAGIANPQILSGSVLTFTYTLRHQESVPAARIRAQFSLDGGGSWQDAVPAVITAPAALTSSPAGTPHTYSWNTVASRVTGQSDLVVLRLIADPADPELPAPPAPQAVPSNGLATRGVPGPFFYGCTSSTSLPFRLRGMIARVVNTQSPAQPISGALVYHLPSGQSRGATPLSHRFSGLPLGSDANGYVYSRDPISLGDQLVAVQTISDTGKLTFAYTSAAPNANGLAALSVGASGGTQTLAISSGNPLLLLNLDLSLEWDARSDTAFMQSLRDRLRRTSEILYDWTNGQVALGKITIYQNKDHWSHVLDTNGAVTSRGADLRVYASNELRPNATQGGIVNRNTSISYSPVLTATYEPGYIRMGGSWNADGDPQVDSAEDWARALAHEVGHYAFFLDETYLGKQGNLLVPVAGCASPMSDPYIDSASEFRPAADWPAACQTTLQHLGTGQAEWPMITRFYNRTAAADGFDFSLNVPASAASNSGPALLPLGVTTFIDAPTSGAAPGASATYGIIPPAGGRYEPSPSARALVFPAGANTPPIDLGAPSAGQLLARGYQSGDRLCVFDPEAALLGCDLTTSGLQLTSAPDWRPDLRITPITYPTATPSPTMTLRVEIPAASVAVGTPPSTLSLRFFPREGEATPVNATLSLASGFYRADIPLPSVVEEGLVQIWFGTGSARRDAVSDYAIGGNPAPRRQPPRRSRRRAPAVSPDGQATIFAEDTTFATGQFFALQRALILPPFPAWATPVGQGYRLLASDPQLLQKTMALSLSYAQGDVPLGLEKDVRVLFHDGTTWTELETHVDTTRNEAAVAVQPALGTYVLVTSLRLQFSRVGWNLIYAYPGASLLPIDAALSSATEQGVYNQVFGYDIQDLGDPWKAFSPLVPGWVNELETLQGGDSYWIYIMKAATVALPIPSADLDAQGLLPAPPSTIYSILDTRWGFVSEADLTVQALMGSAVCGSTTSKAVNGKIVFVLDMLAMDGYNPDCGSNGKLAVIEVLRGSSVLKSVPIIWDNSQIREIGPDGFTLKNAVYLPLVAGPNVPQPDLQVVGVAVVPAPASSGEDYALQVTIRNAGSAAISTPFWVDLYLNSDRTPLPGESWPEVSALGAAWRVYGLGAGATLTLSSLTPNDPLDPGRNYSALPYFMAGDSYTVYAQADSYSQSGGAGGAVSEGEEGNNIAGPYSLTIGP